MALSQHFDAILDDIALKGWSVVPRAFETAYVQALADETVRSYQVGAFRRAGVGHGRDLIIREDIRSDEVMWLNELTLTPLQQQYWQQVNEVRMALNQAFFIGLHHFEAHFARYAPGAFYQRHLDQFRAVHYRLITCILYLNQDWQSGDGGALRIYDLGDVSPALTHDILPEAGTFVCFRSDLIYHEVLPAKRERLSLTGWLRRAS